MALALHSARLAAQSLLGGNSAAQFHRRLAAGISGQIFRAKLLQSSLSAPLLGPALFGAIKLFPKALAISAVLTRLPNEAKEAVLF